MTSTSEPTIGPNGVGLESIGSDPLRPPPMDADQARLLHQPGDPLASTADTVLTAQLGMDAGRTVDAAALGVDGLDLL